MAEARFALENKGFAEACAFSFSAPFSVFRRSAAGRKRASSGDGGSVLCCLSYLNYWIVKGWAAWLGWRFHAVALRSAGVEHLLGRGKFSQYSFCNVL